MIDEKDIETKAKWHSLFKKTLDEFKNTKKSWSEFNCTKKCNYDVCDCPMVTEENYRYGELERNLKQLYSRANDFCDNCEESPLIGPRSRFCHMCGSPKEKKEQPHSKCKNFSFSHKFCPDCGERIF